MLSDKMERILFQRFEYILLGEIPFISRVCVLLQANNIRSAVRHIRQDRVFPFFFHQPVKAHHIIRKKLDRKSTRLNSSHANISYAVFCLKKKNTKKRKCNYYNTFNPI